MTGTRTGTRTRAAKKLRCAAAFNGDETDCAGVLMIVLMMNVPDSAPRKIGRKEK